MGLNPKYCQIVAFTFGFEIKSAIILSVSKLLSSHDKLKSPAADLCCNSCSPHAELNGHVQFLNVVFSSYVISVVAEHVNTILASLLAKSLVQFVDYSSQRHELTEWTGHPFKVFFHLWPEMLKGSCIPMTLYRFGEFPAFRSSKCIHVAAWYLKPGRNLIVACDFRNFVFNTHSQ